MLSSDTEEKIIKFFLGISNGDAEIDKIKQNLINNYSINPVHIFNRIDRDCKGGISQNDLISFLNYYNIPCSNLESELFFYFYDLNMDGLIDFIEFLISLINSYTYLQNSHSLSNKNKICFSTSGFKTLFISSLDKFPLINFFFQAFLNK